MLLKHYFVGNIAHSSYILAGNETCAVIDPRRDTDIYIDEARALGLKITHILETHLHADFISGHVELAGKTGATIYAPKSGNCNFNHLPLSDGDIIVIENVSIKVIETPGHTPEHVSYIVTDTSRGKDPVGIFSGDALFVGDVGRPDLFPGRATQLAGELFDSLHQKIMTLPDFTEVYPAHGAGSLCGRSLGAKYTSTIGYEKRNNRSLLIENRAQFIESLTSRMPPAPDYFSRCSEINRIGPVPTADLPPLAEIDSVTFETMISKPDSVVLDIRGYEAFGGQHIPGSWHIGLAGNFATYAGWMIPQGRQVYLVSYGRDQAEEAVTWLRRIGIDQTMGYLDGGTGAWAAEGLKTGSVPQISAAELHDLVSGKEHITLVDVRSESEYRHNHIDGSINIPVQDLRFRWEELDKSNPVVVICGTGYRSSLGTSILKQKGFKTVYNVAGGMTGYSAAGYTGVCAVCAVPHGSRVFSEATTGA